MLIFIIYLLTLYKNYQKVLNNIADLIKKSHFFGVSDTL
jgi:hypothetical protein